MIPRDCRADLGDRAAAGGGVSCTLGPPTSAILLRGREAASRLAHNQKTVGASPTSATIPVPSAVPLPGARIGGCRGSSLAAAATNSVRAQTARNSGRAIAAPSFLPALGRGRDRIRRLTLRRGVLGQPITVHQ